ncbi:MAG: antibiotic biosynthesis monooxygenase [Deltaproteobacteria bacterium]|nr:antibiotic biosynthesis monooxygenase [Deltaproteobacteria bacterium]
MSISVLIRRTISDEKKAAELYLAPLIVKLRSLATIQPGYISGQTFSCLSNPCEYLVLSTWNSLDDWNRWFKSDHRKALQKQIDELLGEKTRYQIYEPLPGGIITKF